MMLTSPYNSRDEFWSGVAVSSTFGATATASLMAAALAFCPLLREEQTRLDRLPKAHFVREDRPLGEWAAKCEQRRFDLVRIKIDLGICEHRREFLDAIGWTASGELVGEVLRLEVGEFHIPTTALGLPAHQLGNSPARASGCHLRPLGPNAQEKVTTWG